MNCNRLFVFGCSFTSYSWPTWADIISWDLNIPTQNWGTAGIGNQGILCKIVECSLKNNISDNDLILVLWSSWHREDRYLNDQWQAFGDIHSSNFYDDNFIKKYCSLNNDIIKNSTSIISANKLMNIKFNGHILPVSFDHLNLDKKEKVLINFFQKHIPNDGIFSFDNKTPFNQAVKDSHPNILEHFKFVKNVVYRHVGLKIKDSTEELCKKLNDEYIKQINSSNEISSMNALTVNILKKFNLKPNVPNGIF